MKVAIDISLFKTDHKTRGIGVYASNLIYSLNQLKDNLEIKEFDNSKKLPEADLVHYPYFDLFFHSLPIVQKIPRIVTVHDVIPLKFPKHFPVGARGKINFHLQKLALKNTKAVICDSESSKSDIVEKLSYTAEKVHVVYLAPGKEFKNIKNASRLKTIIDKYQLPNQFILYVGDVNWNKNIFNLLEAVEQANVNLVMVGKAINDESLVETKEIMSYIEKLKIKDKVWRAGFISENELVSVYNLAKATILPSFYEGFGLPVLESMACGTPVICSSNSSMLEIAGGLAIFCNPNDPTNISSCIKKVLKEKQPRNQTQKLMMHAAHFSWGNVATQTASIYKMVVSNGGK